MPLVVLESQTPDAAGLLRTLRVERRASRCSGVSDARRCRLRALFIVTCCSWASWSAVGGCCGAGVESSISGKRSTAITLYTCGEVSKLFVGVCALSMVYAKYVCMSAILVRFVYLDTHKRTTVVSPHYKTRKDDFHPVVFKQSCTCSCLLHIYGL